MASMCRSCGAIVKWITTVKGKKMPVDPELVSADDCEKGDLLVTEDGETHYITDRVLAHGEGCEALQGYVSHFATCSAAEDWRKK